MRLLIISSSEKQKGDPVSPVPAIERYDGLIFQVIKKLNREEHFPKDIEVLIVFSKYGLLGPEDKIPYPDELMTFKAAKQHRSNFLQKLKSELQQKKYSENFVNLGSIYLKSIEGFEEFTNAKVVYASGRLGQRAKQTRQWITGESSKAKNI